MMRYYIKQCLSIITLNMSNSQNLVKLKQCMQYAAKHGVFIALITIYTVILGTKILTTNVPFFDWDESIYASIGRQMFIAPSLVAQYEGLPWLEKPPLGPFYYGVFSLLPLGIEVSMRLGALFASLILLIFIYILALRIRNNQYFAALCTFVIACNPIFLQRSQIVNTDILLLLGFTGFFVYIHKPMTRGLWLLVGIFTKSLLGFFPLIIYGMYIVLSTWAHKKHWKELSVYVQESAPFVLTTIFWYSIMALFYQNFVQIHFIDHMVRRVAQSVESHFGQRTFYIDLIISQYGVFTVAIVIGFLLMLYTAYKEKWPSKLAYPLVLFGFFIALIPVKTKIFWYLYPAIPAVVIILFYPLTFIKSGKILSYASVVLLLILVYIFGIKQNIFNQVYSKTEDYQYVAKHIPADTCSLVHILEPTTSRKDYTTLKDLGLTLQSTTTYGSRPSMLYYIQEPTVIDYQIIETQNALQKDDAVCAIITGDDREQFFSIYTTVLESGSVRLIKK
jgi:hypothetical protein